MHDIDSMMLSAIEKTDILLDGEIVSREELIKCFGEFIVKTSMRDGHNVGIVMHTGSVCFDVIAITYAAFLCLLKNETDFTDVIQSLDIGDMVLYGKNKKERYIFNGFVYGKEINASNIDVRYMKLKQNGGGLKYIPEKLWRFVEPYKGVSIRTDGRGIRKVSTIRDDFYVDVLGIASEDIPAIIDTSCVFAMSRERADWLLKGISISFSEKNIKILELITASYFTEEDEYCYGGNTSKNEAIIKITSKLSVARSLLYSRKGNTHIGLFVFDREIINRGLSELPELMNRKSLQTIYLCTPIDAELANTLLNGYDEAEVFACTKHYLNKFVDKPVVDYNQYTSELAIQSAVISQRKNVFELIHEAPLLKNVYEKNLKLIIQIKRSDYKSNEKDTFIIQAYSLMNFIMTAPFTIEQTEYAIEVGRVSVENPVGKLDKLETLIELFPPWLSEKASEIIESLRMGLDSIHTDNEKGKWIKKYLLEHKDEKVAIIVPKAYYIPLVEEYILFSVQMKKKTSVFSIGRFDVSEIYDTVLVVGDIEGKSFNVFQCNSAYKVISLLYEAEEKKSIFKYHSSEKKMDMLYKKSICKDISIEENTVDAKMQVELIESKELEDYIVSRDVIFVSYLSSVQEYGSKHSTNAEVVATAIFSDGTRAYFSKRYRGYVINDVSGTIKECVATDLQEGDSLIFTKKDNDTKDIVDSILFHLIEENRIPVELATAYCESKRWKTALIKYMVENGMSEWDVATKMMEKGVSVQEATVLTWLDEDAHTVGPRKIESIVAIAEFVSDNDLKKDAETVFQSCRKVRSVRRKILEQVGNAIISRLAGHCMQENSEFCIISKRVETMAEIKQIERISFLNQTIPSNLVNRVLTI